jgi:hypothetical protein
MLLEGYEVVYGPPAQTRMHFRSMQNAPVVIRANKAAEITESGSAGFLR